MAQHDYLLADQNGVSFLSDLNDSLAAIASNNSGAVAPSTTYAHQWWADTTANILKRRNSANSAWINLISLDGTALNTASNLSDVVSASAAFTNIKQSATTTATGVVEKATTAEAEAGTADKFPDAAGVVASIAANAASAPSQSQALWNTGTESTESLISPLKLDAKILNRFNVTGTAPLYACRAWVNFNGTGTAAILASGNVSSITDNGTGDYTINVAIAMQDANYSYAGGANYSSAAKVGIIARNSTAIKTATQLQIYSVNSSVGTALDVTDVTVAIFR